MKTVKYSKLIILLCFVMINVYTASAQLRFGIRGGFDVTDNHISKNMLNASNRLGFQIGGTMEARIPIVGLGVEASALYGHQKYDNNFNDADGNAYTLSNYNYIGVPINLKYKFSIVGLFGIFAVVGPYMEFKLSGGDLAQTEGSVVEQWKAKSFGAGINAGAGVELFHHLELGMFYRKSLTDNYDDNNGLGNILKNRPHNWSINATYFF